MQVRDLVRTTTSPNSEPGGIPVYEQYAGVAFGITRGRVRAGTTLRLHDDRFDVLREYGVTFDVGVDARPHPRVRIAAATSFLSPTLAADPSTDVYAGAEVVAADGVRVGAIPTRILVRYGLTYTPDGTRFEHAAGVGIGLGEQITVNASITRESGITASAWRPVVGINLMIGRYVLTAARGNGLNDVGATYRIGLDIGIGT
jgi:hypothetical protein